MSRLHICLMVSSLSGGGAERVAVLLANAWYMDPGVSCVTVITDRLAEGGKSGLVDGIDHLQLPLSSTSRNWVAALSANVGRIRRIHRALRQLRPECVVAFMDEMAVLATLSALGTGIPLIAALRAEPRGPDLNAIWRRLRGPVYGRLSALVVVQTEAGAQQGKALFPGARFASIANPLADLPPVPAMAERQRVILSAGRLVRSKGFDVLIDAFARTRGSKGGWKLRIYGEGPERESLQGQIRRLGLEDAVELKGYDASIAVRMGEASIFAFASRTEGYPNALLEAAAMGCACVSTSCETGPREILQEGRLGLLVPVDDREALATALDRLMSDSQLRAAYSRNSEGFRSRNGIGTISATWLELARGVVRTRSQRRGRSIS